MQREERKKTDTDGEEEDEDGDRIGWDETDRDKKDNEE